MGALTFIKSRKTRTLNVEPVRSICKLGTRRGTSFGVPDSALNWLRTGEQIPLKEMSARELDRALDALEGKGKRDPKKPTPLSGDLVLAGATREEAAADARRLIGLLGNQMADIRKRKGALTGASKQQVLEAVEHLRGIVLKWPAWAKPVDKKGKG